MARIVIVAFGSLGDLHPAIGLALELQARGHDVAIGTSEFYRSKITALGLQFHRIRPNFSLDDETVIRRIMEGSGGSAFLMRKLVFPAVRDMHADMTPVMAQADLMVTAELVCAAPIIAAQQGVRWAFYALSPISFFPPSDPPLLPGPPGTRFIQSLGPGANRLYLAVAKLVSHAWWRPLRRLRRELGLPAGRSPLFEGKHSPELNLALFSSVLQPPRPDWPANTVQAGFIFHDEDNGRGAGAALPVDVERFLASGPAPIVFTLGSAAVLLARDFFEHAASAAQLLGRRALLLLGRNPVPANLPPTMLAWDYLPYGKLFSRAAAVVHQGGVGTTAQVLRAGRPMVIIPFAHDQFDNAARMRRRGVARVISRSGLDRRRIAAGLDALLRDPRAETAAGECAAQIARESGAASAAAALERLLATSRGTPL